MSASTNACLLGRERAGASFPAREMSFILDGGEGMTDYKERLRSLLTDPVFDLQARYYLDKEGMYRRGLAQASKIHKIVRENNLEHLEHCFLNTLLGDIAPTNLHDHVFVPCLRSLANDEQKERWLKKAENYEIIGCYAQTELAHGSNLHCLETTATYIPETDEFEIHTPTITATKWWIGCLGRTATHAVVFAQLLIGETRHGVFPFMVQVRDVNTHHPLSGVSVGDIGSKIGFHPVDNGYVSFDRVRIPRTDMLGRFAHVEKGGRFVKPPHAKLAYATMIFVRASLVFGAFNSLGRAATITTRYSALRRQFAPDKKSEERPVLDYLTQQYRILPLIATAYACQFTGQYMMNLATSLFSGMSSGNLDSLPEVHATSSGLKSLVTTLTCDGIEVLRRACGGHGFSAFSGLGHILGNALPTATVEGENYILTQQTTRYLLKSFQRAVGGEMLPGNLSYLNQCTELMTKKCPATGPADFLESGLQLEAYRCRAASLLYNTSVSLQNEISAGHSQADAWNRSLLHVHATSNAHCSMTMLVNFLDKLDALHNDGTAPIGGSLNLVLKQLCDLFALFYMQQNAGEFVQCGYLSAAQLGMLNEQIRVLVSELRPNAVPLVDAMNFTDRELGSALGRYDGRVYETMLEWAHEEPLNRAD
eukprot:CAMPEP_0174230326 /NCGR_PEP_ID=MMETSP0417-20130205/1096_1 /TAXON_ID=242541 /ORGANISM="Mayorella sp, Strain BSH-02190019" /LENGTH=650 /DNA_ID=CAMNT_0015307983 /DNA_START=50 /DNA_END=1999 /DNA_ORIENTATION=-